MYTSSCNIGVICAFDFTKVEISQAMPIKRFIIMTSLRTRQTVLGQIFVFDDHRSNPTRFIYCLVIKEQNWMGKPYSATLENCFHAMKDHAVSKNITSISMPLIGHSHGDDLSVDLVELILKNIFSPPNIVLNIYP